MYLKDFDTFQTDVETLELKIISMGIKFFNRVINASIINYTYFTDYNLVNRY